MEAREFVIGVLAIAVGALFCFRGYIAMRLIIPVWGAFAGFLLGAGIVASVDDGDLLRSAVAWIVAIVLAVVFAAGAYLYYQVSVAIAMGATGFVLGSSAAAALGVSWAWSMVLVGALVGVLLVFVTIVADLPATLLIVLTALGGASTVVGGAMLLGGVIEADDFEQMSDQGLDADAWWSVIFVVLAVAGIIAQHADGARRAADQGWRDRHLRSTADTGWQ